MPIYAFRCQACGHAFDRLQKLSDPDPRECPECGAEAVKRQVTAPAFRLAGSGWYETDFKSDKDRKRNLAGEEPPKKKEESAGDKAAQSGESAAKAASGDASKPAASPAPVKDAPASG
jgi:putative FmdB family regulatory protein